MVSAVSRLGTTTTTSEKGVHCVSSMCHLFIHCPSSRSSIWSCDNSSVVVCLTTRTFSSAFFRLLQSWLLSPQQPTLKTRVLGSFFSLCSLPLVSTARHRLRQSFCCHFSTFHLSIPVLINSRRPVFALLFLLLRFTAKQFHSWPH